MPYYFDECLKPLKLFIINHFHFIEPQFHPKNQMHLANSSVSILHKSRMGDIDMNVSLKSVLEELPPSDIEELNYLLKDSFPGIFN